MLLRLSSAEYDMRLRTRVDTNGNGVVEKVELLRVHGHGDAGQLLDTMDANEDGVVRFNSNLSSKHNRAHILNPEVADITFPKLRVSSSCSGIIVGLYAICIVQGACMLNYQWSCTYAMICMLSMVVLRFRARNGLNSSLTWQPHWAPAP